jgi:hypothetical protein
VTKIKTEFSGKTILVVGHSDTLPAIIKQLGIAKPPKILPNQFNRIFTVTSAPGTQATMVETKYEP